MSLKLREMWNECEKMSPQTFGVFLEGLQEIADSFNRRHEELSQKPCVAQDRSVRGGLEWTPAEDDLLHKVLSSAVTFAEGYRVFARHPSNANKRPEGGARQRHAKLELDAAKKGGCWL